jgi:hypothetical protein
MADNLTENGTRGDVVGFTPDQCGRGPLHRPYGEPSALLAVDEPGYDPVAEP